MSKLPIILRILATAGLVFFAYLETGLSAVLTLLCLLVVAQELSSWSERNAEKLFGEIVLTLEAVSRSNCIQHSRCVKMAEVQEVFDRELKRIKNRIESLEQEKN